MIALKYYMHRKKRIFFGVLRKYFKRAVPYNKSTFWDDSFYRSTICDRHTIDVNWSQISSLHHYATVELLILQYLFNSNAQVEGHRVLDIGTGAGHWIDFYESVGCKDLVGVEISKKASNYLEQKYAKNHNVDIYNGPFIEFMKKTDRKFNVVNAIGVMFHVVDDDEWIEGIKLISQILEPGGLFIVGGNFGFFNNIDVQVDKNGRSNKRLRSKLYWKKVLRESGFGEIVVLKNKNTFHIKHYQPENNILVAVKQ